MKLLVIVVVHTIPIFSFEKQSKHSNRIICGYYFNLGLTNQKVGQLEQLTFTGRLRLILIQKRQNLHYISPALLKSFGSLFMNVLYNDVSSEVVHSMLLSSPFQKWYRESFVLQFINVTSENNVDKFVFLSLCIIIKMI